MSISSLDLRETERVVVHRGLSPPICFLAEQRRIIANQSKQGYKKVTAAVFLPTIENGNLDLKYLDLCSLHYKTEGEPNAVITNVDSPLNGWWCHLTRIDGQYFAIIGRPDKRYRLGPRYTIPFPNLVSTTQWKVAFDRIEVIAHEYMQDLRAIQYPRLAATFDTSRSPLDS
jgi:hypothetical protein